MYINTDDYIDASEAAKILGIKRARISQLCSEGRFPAQVKIGHFWLIPRSEVEEFQRLKPGKKKIEILSSQYDQDLKSNDQKSEQQIKEYDNSSEYILDDDDIEDEYVRLAKLLPEQDFGQSFTDYYASLTDEQKEIWVKVSSHM